MKNDIEQGLIMAHGLGCKNKSIFNAWDCYMEAYAGGSIKPPPTGMKPLPPVKQKPQEPEHEYKLFYFKRYGKAEPLRMLLAHAGIKYEEVMINHKDEYSRGEVPALETPSGELIVGALKTLARKHGYYPSDVYLAEWVDWLVDDFDNTM